MIGRERGYGPSRYDDRYSKIRVKDLVADHRKLAELILDVHYGRIDNLTIRKGRPVWGEGVLVTREVRFPRDAEQRWQPWDEESFLKVQFVELLDTLKLQPDGTKVSVDIKGALPFRLIVATAA